MEQHEWKDNNKELGAPPRNQDVNGEQSQRREKTADGKDKRRMIPAVIGMLLVLVVVIAVLFGKMIKVSVTGPAAGETESVSASDAAEHTEPVDEELLQIMERCAELEEAGELGAAVICLEEWKKLRPGDPLTEELFAYYTQAYEQQVQDTVAAYTAAGQYLDAIAYVDGERETYECELFRNLSVECRQEFGVYCSRYLAAGKYSTFLICEDGDVTAFGESTHGELKANNWSGIDAIAAGDRHVIGLRPDGTVVAAGKNDYQQCDVSDWRDVIAISAGDVHTVGLTVDGKVIATGYNKEGQTDVYSLVQEAGDRQIVAVSAGYMHTLALLEDGTVLAAGNNVYGECEVSDWRDIVYICSGTSFAAGLRSDGTVMVSGDGTWDWGVSEWTDIVQLAAGDFYLVGLRADGTVVAAGGTDRRYEEAGQMRVDGWDHVVLIAAGNDHTVAIREDGSILTAGSNARGQCG